MAEKAAAFGMRVAFAKHDMSFDELLVTSDILSLHVPLTDGTRHLIDRKALVRMKRSAYLVNTSRGPRAHGRVLRSLSEGRAEA